MPSNSQLPKSAHRLLLASGSSYRKQLLARLGLPFEVAVPDVDESKSESESPEQLATRLAQAKAQALTEAYPRHLIIGSDQVAMVDNTQLQKPGNRERAIEQLVRISGRCIRFYTAICLYDSHEGRALTELDVCTVRFRNLSEEQIIHYVERERPYDCAGAFKSEGLGIALIQQIQGDDPNALIGLPLIRLVTMLAHFGVRVL